MPEIARWPQRMTCEGGLDLVSPIDRMPPGSFSYLINARVIQEGRLEGRPGYSPFIQLSGSDTPNSIRVLNDPDKSYAPLGFTFVGGGGTNLYSGVPGSYIIIDTGYSENPLSLLAFRPDQSPESWMYVYDQNKLQKVRPDGTTRPVGVSPPSSSPGADYGPPAQISIIGGQSLSDGTGYGHSGNISSITLNNREGTGVTSSISRIFYNSGTTGWACMIPTSSSPLTWAGERMWILLNSGGGNQETVLLREIHPAISTTTIQGIQYDSGSTGPCSIVLTGSPEGLDRNSLLFLTGTEYVRVLSVNLSPDGSTYSIRTSTSSVHAPGDSVVGQLSWYIYTVQAHSSAESIVAQCIYAHGSSLGTAKSATNSIYNIFSTDASSASGRPIDLANDYCHISLWVTNAQALIQLQLVIDVDANTTSISNAFMNN